MTRKGRRLSILAASFVCLGAASTLALVALDDALLYFYSPSDVAAGLPPPDRAFRLGGMVAVDSVVHGDGHHVRFAVTDTVQTVTVVFDGVLPDLFQEGQGVVAEGRLNGDGLFVASDVLAKHDETYMPPEVAEALDAADPGWRTRAAQSVDESGRAVADP